MKDKSNITPKQDKVIKTLSASSNSIYSFERNGKQSILGFDSKGEVQAYLDETNANPNMKHFMDNTI